MQLRKEFFETDEFRAAFESEHIGRVFRAYRNHPRHLSLFGKALNQEVLGRWLGLTQAQVSKIENGSPEYNLKTLRFYAVTLHLPQKMLWFKLSAESRIGAQRDWEGDHLPRPEASMILPAPQLTLPSYQHNFLSQQFIAEKSVPDTVHLKSARIHFQQMYRNLGGFTTGIRLEHFLARQALSWAVSDGEVRAVGQDAKRAIGGLIALAGVCAYDSEDWATANARFAQALSIAESSRDHGFHAYVVALMVNQSLALEDFRRADSLALLGLKLSAKAPASSLAVDLQAMRAKALAMLGDSSAAKSAIRELEVAINILPAATDIAEADYAQQGHLQARLAEALIDLGDMKAAKLYAEQSLSSDGHARGKVNRLASMVAIETAIGEPERAVLFASEMIDQSRGMESRRLGRRFMEIRSALARQSAEVSRDVIGMIDSAVTLIP